MKTTGFGKKIVRELIFLQYLAIDVLLFNVGILAAFYIRFLGKPPATNFYSYIDLLTLNVPRGIFPFALLIPAIIFSAFELYRRNWFNEKVEEYIHIIHAVAVSSAMLLVTTYTYRHVTGTFPTSVVFLSLIINCFLLCQWRLIVRHFYTKALYERLGDKNLLFVGLSGIGPESLSRIRENVNPGYRIVGYLRGRTERDLTGDHALPCLGWADRLVDAIAAHDVDEVMISTAVLSNEESVAVLHDCEVLGIRYRIIPSLFDMVMSKARVDLLNFVPIIYFGNPRIDGFGSIFKRLFDLVGGTIILIAASPFMLGVALWIRIGSKGPALFIQKRVGHDGRLFAMYKFRTMKVGSHNGSPLTQAGDDRITRVGRFLRKWSVDELPQLINVIKGDMSLVGPRAVVPYVADHFDKLERTALAVLPGMTGMAQVYGRDELSFRDKSLLNIYYIRNYSFMMDLKILLKTLSVVFSQVGTEGTCGAEAHREAEVAAKRPVSSSPVSGSVSGATGLPPRRPEEATRSVRLP